MNKDNIVLVPISTILNKISKKYNRSDVFGTFSNFNDCWSEVGEFYGSLIIKFTGDILSVDDENCLLNNHELENKIIEQFRLLINKKNYYIDDSNE